MRLIDRIKTWWAQTSFVASKADRELATKRLDDAPLFYIMPEISVTQSIVWEEMESLKKEMEGDFSPDDLSVTFDKWVGCSTLYGRLKEFDFFFVATGEDDMVAFISDGTNRVVEYGNVCESYEKLRDKIKKQKEGKTIKPPFETPKKERMRD